MWWAYDLCLFKHETGDPLNEKVIECVDMFTFDARKLSNCEAKTKFKTKLCELHYKSKDEVHYCMSQDIPLGPTVKGSGI